MLSRFTRGKLLIAALVVLLLAMPLTVLAANPHFVNASASIDNSGALVVNFKEAGLGQNQNVDFLLTADASATYYCINGGGKNPKAANKQDVAGPVTGSGTFSSGKNGQITASLSAGPVSSGGFACPPGQRLVLGAVSYSNIRLADMTNNVYADIPGELSRVFFDLG